MLCSSIVPFFFPDAYQEVFALPPTLTPAPAPTPTPTPTGGASSRIPRLSKKKGKNKIARLAHSSIDCSGISGVLLAVSQWRQVVRQHQYYNLSLFWKSGFQAWINRRNLDAKSFHVRHYSSPGILLARCLRGKVCLILFGLTLSSLPVTFIPSCSSSS